MDNVIKGRTALIMVSKFIIFTLSVLAVCSFCGEDFISLGRHTWRCKRKLHQGASQNDVTNGNSHLPQDLFNLKNNMSDNNGPANTEEIKCACGKKCKGLRGLKAHQRSCQTIKTLCNEVLDDLNSNNRTDQQEEIIDENIVNEHANLKTGINLPKNDKDWETANSFFHLELSINDINTVSLDEVVNKFNETIYNYFRDDYGTVKNNKEKERKFNEKYKNSTKGQLKKQLKSLKNQSPNNVDEVRYVSKLLRSKITEAKSQGQFVQKVYSIDHDNEIKKNFWGYVKFYMEKPKRIIPNFDKKTCFDYFVKSFKCISPLKQFQIPSWIPKFREPLSRFDLNPPSYAEICKVIKRMKSKGSPCPLDQISIICFKKCPYLRTYITAICAKVWETNHIPTSWKRAVSILIYKKDFTDNPANFRPITLEPVALKIFTSSLRNKICAFLRQNNFIESHIQKGFVHNMSGTFGHTAHLAYVINNARVKQRSLHVTLLDLKNAFGEVNHNLLDCVFEYHHIPIKVRTLVRDLYTDFSTAIASDAFVTDVILVGRGVLQGDFLSPLAFNMVINTFIQFIKNEKYQQFGYNFIKYMIPRHWYQFADDAAVVTGLEHENQVLLYAFNRWCTWADMIIRVDKCHSFRLKKVGSSSRQYEPKL